jgi:D-glycero-alpha-D-manno-heptose-7-phosphate kinase
MRIRVRAPLRIDFAGGVTDGRPFAERFGGAVVAAAVDLCVHADLLLGDRRIRLHDQDRDDHLTVASSDRIAFDGRLDLHKWALTMLPVTGGIEILTRCDAPLGAGLGCEGGLAVALLAGLARAREETYSPEELAELACMAVEQDIGPPSSANDAYTAALGGVRHLVFGRAGVEARDVALAPEAMADLHRHLVVVYTGRSHFTEATKRRVWSAVEADDPSVVGALSRMRELVEPAGDALRAADWRRLADVMDEHWRAHRQLDGTIATARMAAVEDAAWRAGVWGMKATGAGAGGCLAAICAPDRRPAVLEAVAAAGGQVLEAGFSERGVEVHAAEAVL